MKICSFGTLRLDIRMFQKKFDLLRYNESKATDMLMKVGGSVYYTSVLLACNYLKIDYYTLHHDGDLSDYISAETAKGPLNIIESPDDNNTTAVSVILLDGNGGKKTISYDGNRQDSRILKSLCQRANDYDFFYTSFYEVNENNISEIESILNTVRHSFIDLSPLIYRVHPKVIETVLRKVTIVSGTRDEYSKLFEVLGIASIEELMNMFPISEVYEKRGRNGAALYYRNGMGMLNANSISVYEVSTPGTGFSNDTTGCGDTFSAAIIAGKAKFLSGIELLQFAVNSATLVAYKGFLPNEIVNAWEKGFSFNV